MDLLLIGDEQESMVRLYLERGDLFALSDQGEVRAVSVVTDEGGGVCELKNIAVYPVYHGKGYGRALIEHVCNAYRGQFQTLIVGTGEVPGAMRFYERCGFEPSHRVENFFTDNYDHTMVEQGVTLKDIVYFKRGL